jgi:hypothetical protein
VRGVGYVKTEQSAAWPPTLQNLVSAAAPCPVG